MVQYLGKYRNKNNYTYSNAQISAIESEHSEIKFRSFNIASQTLTFAFADLSDGATKEKIVKMFTKMAKAKQEEIALMKKGDFKKQMAQRELQEIHVALDDVITFKPGR